MATRVFLIVSILSFILVPTMVQAQRAADADFDGSGAVGLSDFLAFVGAYGSSQAKYDLDGNGVVGLTDFLRFVGLFGQAVPPTIVVNSAADSGSGTLRQALLDAQSGGTITFDPSVFPPEASATIYLTSSLPPITHGGLMIDGSNAGVVLDGSRIEPVSDELVLGLTIVSDGNIIRGLQVIRFPGAAVSLQGGSNNIVGGDRGIGAGPLGQGNLLSGNGGGVGVTIWSEDTASNTIIGNYIGTDLSGVHPLANHTGVSIELGAHDNVIGPDNIIAHNLEDGIAIGLSAVDNTITQNSIHDNGRQGILLSRGGNNELSVPLLLGFDLQAGSLTGWTHPNSIVEIFSDGSDEGAFYEGRVVADGSGAFAFRKEAAFTGPRLTTTATDPDGNTSEFSLPTEGSSGFFGLQEDNSLAMIRLQSKTSNQLVADVRLGYGTGFLAGELQNWRSLAQDVFDIGAKRLNTSLGMGEAPIDWSFPEDEIPVEYDRFIDAMNENGVAVNYGIHWFDKIGHAAGEVLPIPRFKTDEEIQDFLDYVRFIVGHYKGRVQYYTIWSEPDACGGSIDIDVKCIEPLDYIELARQTIPVIREVDPQAKVVTGGIGLYYGRDLLFTLLRSDVIQLFDVIDTHPMFDAAPDIEFIGFTGDDPLESFAEYYYQYPAIIDSILQTASAHGFQGQYWGSDLTWSVTGWPDHPADQPWEGHTETQSIKYHARAIAMHLGLDAGVNPVVQKGIRAYSVAANLYAILAGTEPINLGVEIESEATNIVSYGFTDPTGDTLFALWTDGAAVDDDPGVKTTLTFPGVSASRVTGIDVLDGFDGFEQELIAETGSGDLVIRNLLVRDYPIIVRLID